jgi:hypothetical protein
MARVKSWFLKGKACSRQQAAIRQSYHNVTTLHIMVMRLLSRRVSLSQGGNGWRAFEFSRMEGVSHA